MTQINSQPFHQYYNQPQRTKTIKLNVEIDKIWNSKEDPEFINKIFM